MSRACAKTPRPCTVPPRVVDCPTPRPFVDPALPANEDLSASGAPPAPTPALTSASYGLPSVVNRCGVASCLRSGKWLIGSVDGRRWRPLPGARPAHRNGRRRRRYDGSAPGWWTTLTTSRGRLSSRQSTSGMAGTDVRIRLRSAVTGVAARQRLRGAPRLCAAARRRGRVRRP
jgi:hypothetical protein